MTNGIREQLSEGNTHQAGCLVSITFLLRSSKLENKKMENREGLIESLFERAETYGKTTYELSKLKVLETTTRVTTTVVSRLGVIIMISLFILILSIGVALLLGEVMGKSYYGFFIVAAFYLVTGIVFYFFLHRWVKKPLSELIIKHSLQ
ncbi:MAG: hypothetical protein ABUT20_28870 [Bacteroidota bacterium]